MDKENLILTHSFPTNSILLNGLIDYLDDFFNVYFIDLPGFTQQVPPLKKVELEGFYKYASDKVAEFNLPHFIAGGISFGFLVMNNVKYDERCKGILAIEPFMGGPSLKMDTKKRARYNFLIGLVSTLRVYDPVWKSKWLRVNLPKLRHYPPGTIDVMLDEIDGRTFIEVGKLLLSEPAHREFQNRPYVLIGNPEDRTVNFPYIEQTMREGVDRLLVITTDLEHFPKDTSKAYFQSKIPGDLMNRVLEFVNQQGAAL